jgi:hypothetical protein
MKEQVEMRRETRQNQITGSALRRRNEGHHHHRHSLRQV